MVSDPTDGGSARRAVSPRPQGLRTPRQMRFAAPWALAIPGQTARRSRRVGGGPALWHPSLVP
jgi:hypothetical protein